MTRALAHLRICDFTGQLAGAGATKYLAAFGAEVIRIEDPVMQGRWDILRGMAPFLDERRGIDLGGSFNNHNVEKLGITLNLRTEKAKEVLRKLIASSDVVTENFAAGVLARLGFSYEQLKEIKPNIIYVSNCGFGHTGPYVGYKTWGPIVQAVSGLTFSSGLPGMEPAGWGYSYMDHTGAYYMAIAIMAAIHHRNRTGEGQWVDLGCTEAGAALNGPSMLDFTVNGRPLRREGSPNSNRNQFPPMAPHGIYPTEGDDNWVAISCRDDDDWRAFAGVAGPAFATDARFATLQGRLEHENELDGMMAHWCAQWDRFEIERMLKEVGVPCEPVRRPQERIDFDPNTEGFGLWPTVHQTAMGDVRVDGIPIHLSKTDWSLEHGAPCLGEHNDRVIGGLLGYSENELAEMREGGVI